VFTVPATGRYSVKATINYTTVAALSVQLGTGVYPSFRVRRTSPVVTELITGIFPVLNVNIALLLTLRVILGSGEITLAGDVELNAGDTVVLVYAADTLTINISLGGAENEGIVWSIHQIA